MRAGVGVVAAQVHAVLNGDHAYRSGGLVDEALVAATTAATAASVLGGAGLVGAVERRDLRAGVGVVAGDVEDVLAGDHAYRSGGLVDEALVAATTAATAGLLVGAGLVGAVERRDLRAGVGVVAAQVHAVLNGDHAYRSGGLVDEALVAATIGAGVDAIARGLGHAGKHREGRCRERHPRRQYLCASLEPHYD